MNKSEVFNSVQQNVSLSFDNYEFHKNSFLKNRKNHDYDDLFNQIERAIVLTQKEIFTDDLYHSIFIWGDTGIGKSAIIKEIAEKHDAVYHKLEIQKVPIEELQGFPYLYESTKKETLVRLAHPTILPPSDDDRLWVLHLDEFNKADTESMAAVMNLVYNGEIGGSADYDEKTGKSIKYKLPRKTVIIGSGNKKTQTNTTMFNTVNSFDIATAERWHRNIFLEYNALSWISSFAGKPYTWNGFELPTRILNLILYYVFDKAMDDDPKAPFIIPKILDFNEEDMSGDSTMSPRAWTFLSDNMLNDMYLKWSSLSEEEKKIYENMVNDSITNSFAAFVLDPKNQVEAIYNNAYELGAEAYSLIEEIISRFSYFAENRVLPNDVITNYASCRDKVRKMSDRKGAVLYLLLGVAQILVEQENYSLREAAINISTFITDADIPAEDLSAFIFTLERFNTEKSKEINDLLFSINNRYKNAYQGYYYTSEKELLGESA